MDAQGRSKGVVVNLDPIDHPLAPPTTEVLVGVVSLMCILGLSLDGYHWIAQHRPPALALVYMPSCTVSLFRWFLVTPSENGRRRTPLWWVRAMIAYYALLVVLAVVVPSPPGGYFVWFAAIYLGISVLLFRRELNTTAEPT